MWAGLISISYTRLTFEFNFFLCFTVNHCHVCLFSDCDKSGLLGCPITLIRVEVHHGCNSNWRFWNIETTVIRERVYSYCPYDPNKKVLYTMYILKANTKWSLTWICMKTQEESWSCTWDISVLIACIFFSHCNILNKVSLIYFLQ